MSEIEPGLFLENLKSCYTRPLLETNGINAIVPLTTLTPIDPGAWLQRENTFQKAVTSGFFVKILRYKISLSTWTTFVNYRPHVAIRISWSQKDHQILSDGRRRIESSDL